MRFFLPASASCLLIGSIFLNVAATPVSQHVTLQFRDASVSSLPVLDARMIISLEENQPNVARAPKKTKTKSKSKPKTPAKKPKTPAKKPKTPAKKPKAPAKKPKTPAKTPDKHQPQWKGPVPSESAINKKCTVPKDKALFWSGTSPKVHNYNAKAGLVTDSQAYPNGYTWRFRGKDNAKAALFAERFSRVFAQKASGVVHLMVPWAKGPTANRVFHKDEWPILKKSLKSGKVTKIIQVNPDNFQETRVYDPKVYGLTKRAEVDLDKAAWDVDLDALADAWEKRTIEEEE